MPGAADRSKYKTALERRVPKEPKISRDEIPVMAPNPKLENTQIKTDSRTTINEIRPPTTPGDDDNSNSNNNSIYLGLLCVRHCSKDIHAFMRLMLTETQ